jgi:phi13 family phage major tail protein
MALVGLDQVYVAEITETDGVESYATPIRVAGAIDASISPSIDTANIFSDDSIEEIITQFSSVEVSFTFSDIGSTNYAMLLGKETDSNGVVMDSADDIAPYFALGFRSKKSNGEYRYVWMYKGRFNQIEESFATQSDSADFQTAPVTGTFVKRNSDGKWRAKVDSDDATVGAGVIDGWFTAVYETPTTTV